MKIKAKILVSDYKKALENFREITQREFRELCKQVAKEIKQNWFNNFWDYLIFIRYNEDGISELLMKKDDNHYRKMGMMSIENYCKIKHKNIDKEMIDSRINSLNLIQDEFIYVDAEALEFVNKYIRT